MSIQIESGIPIPGKRAWGRQSSGIADVLKLMKVGESIVIPKEKRNGTQSVARTYGIKIVTRITEDDKIRIWRVA